MALTRSAVSPVPTVPLTPRAALEALLCRPSPPRRRPERAWLSGASLATKPGTSQEILPATHEASISRFGSPARLMEIPPVMALILFLPPVVISPSKEIAPVTTSAWNSPLDLFTSILPVVELSLADPRNRSTITCPVIAAASRVPLASSTEMRPADGVETRCAAHTNEHHRPRAEAGVDVGGGRRRDLYVDSPVSAEVLRTRTAASSTSSGRTL